MPPSCLLVEGPSATAVSRGEGGRGGQSGQHQIIHQGQPGYVHFSFLLKKRYRRAFQGFKTLESCYNETLEVTNEIGGVIAELRQCKVSEKYSFP